MQYFRKSRVESGSECQPLAQAIAAPCPAQRPFRGKVNGIGFHRVQHRRHPLRRAHCQVDARIAGARTGCELAGVQHLHLVPGRFKLLHQFQQGGNHPIDLGQPSVCQQGNFHTTAADSAREILATGEAGHCNSSSLPSMCSTKAVWLSTQSPSLQ